MGLFDMFTAPKPDAAVPANVTANPTVPNANNTPTQVTTQNAAGGEGATPASPLDNFKDLWQADKNAPAPLEPFSLKSDPAELLKAAQTVDFTKIVTPELQKRIQAGGADAMAAMMEANNAVAQMTFAQSTHATSKIVEQSMAAMEKRFQDMLPGIIKQHAVSTTLQQENPLLTNPAMAPMISALQLQITQKFPNATPLEINKYVNDYLNGAADLIASQRPQPASANKRAETDWSKYLGA